MTPPHPGARIHPTAEIEDGVEIGAGTAIWSGVHVRGPGTRIGADCIVGERTHIGYGVQIGDRVKLNAFVYVCTGVTIETGVMIGAGHGVHQRPLPAGDHARPRDACAVGAGRAHAADPGGRGRVDRRRLRDRLRPHASVASRWSAWARSSPASAPPFHLVVGQPARSVAVVSRVGEPIVRFSGAQPPDREEVVCPVSGLRYAIRAGEVIELDPPS